MRHALGDVKTAFHKLPKQHVSLEMTTLVLGTCWSPILAEWPGLQWARGLCLTSHPRKLKRRGPDIGALQWQKSGKSKGKEKGHHKDKGKMDEGMSWKGKGKDHGKRKPGGKGESPPGTVAAGGQLQGYCDYCGAWGRKRAHCPRRTQKVAGLEDQNGNAPRWALPRSRHRSRK